MSLLPLALVTACLLLAERAGYMVRGCLAIATLIWAAAIVNRWIKLSNHMAVASFAAIIFYQLWPMTVFALVVVIPLLAWSRVVLARHTIREVLGGILLGALVAEVLLRT